MIVIREHQVVYIIIKFTLLRHNSYKRTPGCLYSNYVDIIKT